MDTVDSARKDSMRRASLVRALILTHLKKLERETPGIPAERTIQHLREDLPAIETEGGYDTDRLMQLLNRAGRDGLITIRKDGNRSLYSIGKNKFKVDAIKKAAVVKSLKPKQELKKEPPSRTLGELMKPTTTPAPPTKVELSIAGVTLIVDVGTRIGVTMGISGFPIIRIET